MKPRVSVVLPFRDPGRFLPAALGCLLRQTFGDLEVIAVDDGSADGSFEWLEGVADPSVRAVRGERPGLVEALNLGVELARGEFVARMDADDLCASDRIEAQVRFLDGHPDHVLVGTAFAAIDEENRPLYADPVPCEDGEIRRALRRGNRFLHGSVMMRRRTLLEAGGYRREMTFVEDYDLWTRLAERGRIANLPRILYWWRIHGAGVSLRNFVKQEAMADLVRRCAEARRAGSPEPLAEATLPASSNGSPDALARRRAESRLTRWFARRERLRGRPRAAALGYLRAALLCPWDPLLYEEVLLDVIGGRDRRRRTKIPTPPRVEAAEIPERGAEAPSTGLRSVCS